MNRDPVAISSGSAGSLPLPNGLAALTDQERKILKLVAQGLTNREIAQRICLAEKTVRNYVSNVLAKLGMKNRTQVAVYVARSLLELEGWSAPEDDHRDRYPY